MNPYVIRESLKQKQGSKVLVKVFGMRNKKEKYIGILKDIYPQIFTIDIDGTIKSFSYCDLISKDVTLSFL